MKKILYIMSVAAIMLAVTSCGKEDDLTESIFDTSKPAVDPTQSTYEFDQWLYDNFLQPYNVEVQYRFNFTASDMNFQLTPADYGRSQLLAHFIRYLFYDVYTKYAGENFMKSYLPLHWFIRLQPQYRYRGSWFGIRWCKDYALQHQRDEGIL